MEPDEQVIYEEVLPCEGKLVFDTRKQAQATATTSAYQNGGSVKPYMCNYCHLWHLSRDYEAS